MSVASTATPQQRSYFDLFEVPPKLWIEMSALEKKFPGAELEAASR